MKKKKRFAFCCQTTNRSRFLHKNINMKVIHYILKNWEVLFQNYNSNIDFYTNISFEM